MASIKERDGSFQVRWQAGRAGRREVCTFPTIELAEAAQRLADARNHRITDREVYAAIYGWNEEDTETGDCQENGVTRSCLVSCGLR
jgi:hypothetical protein